MLSLAFVLALVFPATARADGIIIPDPPICADRPCIDPGLPIPMDQLVIRYHRVTVRIQDQVAITHVDQVFYNPNDWTIEGTYVFPLPVDAAVSSFTLWVDGEPVQGQIMDADEARQTYEQIVRQLKDPALLEYAGQGAMRARIFPIAPQGERRIELEYSQVLLADEGLVRYQYPLNTEKFSALPLENVSVTVELRDRAPIRAVYSPSHPISVQRESAFHVDVGYEAAAVRPDADFSLFYSLGDQQALHVLSYMDPGEPDGFFTLLLAPRPDARTDSLPKDVLLVLDRSGSMEGEKFRQAQDALGFILGRLGSQDRFNVITFSTAVEAFASGLRPAADGARAIDWVERQSAAGSTDINRALLEAAAMADRERPSYLIFLTDGLPTAGVVESPGILKNLASAASSNLRLFAFGVGYDVDTFLLDSLAQSHHGTSTYVLPGERLDEILSGFYAKISTPVLTDLALDFGDLQTYDLYPAPLPDLFAGSQILVVGRYRRGGTTTITLTGQVESQTQTFRYPEQTFSTGLRDFRPGKAESALPRLWATRKIGHLLNQVRLQGPDPETIDQIVRLSIRYGIVTPYTSYLVTEPLPLGMEEQSRIASEQYQELQGMPTAPSYGQDAVEKAVGQGALADAEAAVVPEGQAAETVRVLGSRAFVLVNGVWVDTSFDPGRMQTVKVAFLSDDYFALAGARPDLAAAFALGPQVIVLSEGKAYEVVEDGAPVEPVVIPATALPVAVEGDPGPAPAVDPGPQPDPGPATAPAPLPCLGGLLPAVLLPVGLLFSRRLRR